MVLKYKENSFKVDDLVVCVYNRESSIKGEVTRSTISIGTIYKVNHSAKYFISLYNDYNMLGSYDYNQFMLLSDYRVNIIDEIIGEEVC